MPQLHRKPASASSGRESVVAAPLPAAPANKDAAILYTSHSMGYPGPGRGLHDAWLPTPQQRRIVEEGKELRLWATYAKGNFFRAMQEKVGGIFTKFSNSEILEIAVRQKDDIPWADAARGYRKLQPTIDPIVYHFRQIRELRTGELRFVFERGFDLDYNVPFSELRRGFFWSRRLSLEELREECLAFRRFVKHALREMGMSDRFRTWWGDQ